MTTEVVITITDFTRIPEPVLALVNDVAKRKGGLTEWESVYANNTTPHKSLMVGKRSIQNVVALITALYDDRTKTGRIKISLVTADDLPRGFMPLENYDRYFYLHGERDWAMQRAQAINQWLSERFEQAENWIGLMSELKAHVRELEDAAEVGTMS